jgi:hypothetical protein
MKTWGLIIDATSRFARVVRDLPVHVLVICLDEVEDGVHQPSLYGKKLPGELGQFFNACGFLSKQEHNGRVRYEVMFEGSDRFPVKTMQGLDAVEAPEPLWWIHKRFGGPLPADVAKRVADWKALGPEEVAVPQQLAEEPAKEEVEGKQQEDKVDEDDPFNSK